MAVRQVSGPEQPITGHVGQGQRPGRSCPLHYRYSPSVFARAPELRAEALYVAGGLYGNPFALARLLEMCDAERGDTRLVFNGDFNWFNSDASSFAQINETVLRHTALRGNVETELATDDADGCGCAYPEWVSENIVAWSNQIMQTLRDTAQGAPALRDRLQALPMHLVAEVGGHRIAIVHGDAESLAGWSFAHEALSVAQNNDTLKHWFAAAEVRIFASTHTCLPVVKRLTLASGDSAIVNNGSAGMPNLKDTQYGLVTRIATYPCASAAIHRARIDDLYIDLLKVDFDHARWLTTFESNWPPGSAAHLSYFKRIVNGPDFRGPVVL